MEDLGDDFARSQVADETHLAGGAEDAAHGATGLGAEACGVAAGVAHEDGLDGLTVVEAEEVFAGLAVGAGGLGLDGREGGGEAGVRAELRADPAAKGREEIVARDEVDGAVAVDGTPECAGMNGAKAGGDEFAFQGAETEVVDGAGHAGNCQLLKSNC